ncbi:MAG: carboxypeptidase-like regulatory domain-containing protein, partial [Rhodothermales bacterium]|nr:carboxypeptidase-like regulatory domain-containing protein [Rhodothermales bacterium]
MRRFATITTLLGLLLCLGSPLATAQEREVRGTVVDATTGDPLPGVNIIIRDPEFGTATDIDGNY